MVSSSFSSNSGTSGKTLVGRGHSSSSSSVIEEPFLSAAPIGRGCRARLHCPIDPCQELCSLPAEVDRWPPL